MHDPVDHPLYERTTFVDVGGTRLHVYDEGVSPAGAPAVVLLHGFGTSLLSWRRVLDRFGDRRVVAFDRPGLGRSPVPPSASGRRAFVMDDEADLTVALLETLGIDHALLVGNSAGGAIAVEVADRAPERVVGLVLVDAAVLGELGPPPAARRVLGLPGLSLVGPRLLAVATPCLIGRVVRRAWHDADGIDAEARSCAMAAFQEAGWAPALWAASVDPTSPAVAEHAAALDVPTLVVSGDDDRLVPLADSRRLAARIPGARLTVIPSCGHVPQEECPDTFLEAVLPFVAAVSEPAALPN